MMSDEIKVIKTILNDFRSALNEDDWNHFKFITINSY
jgi:hypothetical protein